MAVSEVAGRRMAAEIDGDFVVFLIGARFNNKLQFARSLVDLGGRRGMKHMLDYLVARPEKGLLAYEMGIPTIVQYWRSFEQLEALPRTRTTRTWTRGANTGDGSDGAAAPVSGTRRFWSRRDITRPSTGTCRRADWVGRGGSYRCRNPQALAAGSKRSACEVRAGRACRSYVCGRRRLGWREE